MKKFLALLLAAMMVLSLTAIASADGFSGSYLIYCILIKFIDKCHQLFHLFLRSL